MSDAKKDFSVSYIIVLVDVQIRHGLCSENLLISFVRRMNEKY